MNNVHRLKIYPQYFQQIKHGNKNFEIRKNDRNYELYDEILLEEFVPKGYNNNEEGYYTGQICHRKIVYIFKDEGFGLEKGYVILSLEKL